MRMLALPVAACSAVATFLPLSGERTGMITFAPALASARTVSTPSPAEAPVTMAVLPFRSTPFTTSAAVDLAPNGDDRGLWARGISLSLNICGGQHGEKSPAATVSRR